MISNHPNCDLSQFGWRLGLATPNGVKQAQIKLGLPADSFPTAELIGRLGGR